MVLPQFLVAFQCNEFAAGRACRRSAGLSEPEFDLANDVNVGASDIKAAAYSTGTCKTLQSKVFESAAILGSQVPELITAHFVRSCSGSKELAGSKLLSQ